MRCSREARQGPSQGGFSQSSLLGGVTQAWTSAPQRAQEGGRAERTLRSYARPSSHTPQPSAAGSPNSGPPTGGSSLSFRRVEKYAPDGTRMSFPGDAGRGRHGRVYTGSDPRMRVVGPGETSEGLRSQAAALRCAPWWRRTGDKPPPYCLLRDVHLIHIHEHALFPRPPGRTVRGGCRMSGAASQVKVPVKTGGVAHQWSGPGGRGPLSSPR